MERFKYLIYVISNTMAYIMQWKVTTLTPSNRIRFYYAMYGRVRKNKGSYQTYLHYYPGFLDNIPHRKLSRNSIVCDTLPIIPDEFKDSVQLDVINHDFDLGGLETARNKFRLQYEILSKRPINLFSKEEGSEETTTVEDGDGERPNNV